MTTNQKVHTAVTLVTTVESGMKALDELEAQVVGDTPALTVLDKKRRAKLRKGGERAVTAIATLVKQYQIESTVLQADTMTANLQRAADLAPLYKRTETLLKRLGDAVFLANSAAWKDACRGYVTLRHMARTEGDLEVALMPVAELFAAKHPAVVAARAAKKAEADAAKAAKAAAKAAGKAGTNPGKPVVEPAASAPHA